MAAPSGEDCSILGTRKTESLRTDRFVLPVETNTRKERKMDPRLMNITGFNVLMAPADDLRGGDGHVDTGDDDTGDDTGDDDDDDIDDDDDDDTGDDDDDDDDDDTDDDGTDDGDDGDGDDDDDGDGDDDDDGDGDDDDEGDDELGKRAQKRIRKLLAERKDAETRVKVLERQLEDAKKLGGDDGKAILTAAESCGILPGLMSKDEAEAFATMERLPAIIDMYNDWLDEHGPDDEFETGDGTMSYGQVKKRVRQLTAKRDSLKEEYGDRRKALRAKVREIFEAGLEALKERRKPSKKPSKTGKPKKERKNRIIDKPPENNRQHKRGGGNVDEMDVFDDDSLERFIQADMRRNRK